MWPMCFLVLYFFDQNSLHSFHQNVFFDLTGFLVLHRFFQLEFQKLHKLVIMGVKFYCLHQILNMQKFDILHQKLFKFINDQLKLLLIIIKLYFHHLKAYNDITTRTLVYFINKQLKKLIFHRL